MKTFILYNDNVSNSDGTRVLLDGLKLERFQKNPVMLYMHHRGNSHKEKPDGSEVIGKWKNIRIVNNKLIAEAIFDENDPFAKKIAEKVNRGFLKGASIGIDVHNISDSKDIKFPDQKNITITDSTLLEASIVDIPKNEGSLNHCSLYQNFSYKEENKKQQDFFKKIKTLFKIEEEIDENYLLKKIEDNISSENKLKEWKCNFITRQSDKLIDNALKENFINEEDVKSYRNQFLNNFEKAEENLYNLCQKCSTKKSSKIHQFLSKIQAPVPLGAAATVSSPESGNSVYNHLLKKEPRKLKTLQQQDPATFRQLLEAHLAWKAKTLHQKNNH